MRTGEFLKKTGISRETLRFYERKGLLPAPPRTSSGYRIYSTALIQRLKFIKTAQQAGFTLKEIKELLELKQKKVSCREGRNIALKKREELQQKMKAIREMKKILNRFILKCEEKGKKGLQQQCHFSFDEI
ncbi:MAG: MerR family transcriptional regulator [Bdellovibrio sp.]|nr:MAG: MerR family transcriptional regulator [Bdellovibrio sp.]